MHPEIALVVIPEGRFWMGSDEGPDNERPRHSIWIDRFALAETAVTNAQYAPFLKATSRPPAHGCDDERFNHPDQPATGVSWFDATAYCAWLGQSTGIAYRLPTEGEWERAARGGVEGKRFTWGDEPPQDQPRYDALWRTGPERVAMRPPNAFGLFDISENVHEWCSDWYDALYYAVSPERNPTGPDAGTRRASRGGSWRHHVKISRVSARSSLLPHLQYADYGFRCAATLTTAST